LEARERGELEGGRSFTWKGTIASCILKKSLKLAKGKEADFVKEEEYISEKKKKRKKKRCVEKSTLGRSSTGRS